MDCNIGGYVTLIVATRPNGLFIGLESWQHTSAWRSGSVGQKRNSVGPIQKIFMRKMIFAETSKKNGKADVSVRISCSQTEPKQSINRGINIQAVQNVVSFELVLLPCPSSPTVLIGPSNPPDGAWNLQQTRGFLLFPSSLEIDSLKKFGFMVSVLDNRWNGFGF